MKLSTEESNFMKITRIVLDLVPKYLRNLFIARWDEKFPELKWQSDKASGMSISRKIKKNGRNRVSFEKLKKGNEQEWDTTTLVFVMLYSNLELIEKARDKDKREHPLLISEAIDSLREIRNKYFAHADSMSCPFDVFESVIADARDAAKYLAEDAEKEIEAIVNSQIEVMTDQKERVEYEKNRQAELEKFFQGKR